MANFSTISLFICMLAFASTIATRTRRSDNANPKNMVNISRSIILTCYFCNSCSEASAAKLKLKEICKEGQVCVKQVMRNNYPVRGGTYNNMTITRGCTSHEANWKIDGSCEKLETLNTFDGSFQCFCKDEHLCNFGNTRWISSPSLGLFMPLLALLVIFS